MPCSTGILTIILAFAKLAGSPGQLYAAQTEGDTFDDVDMEDSGIAKPNSTKPKHPAESPQQHKKFGVTLDYGLAQGYPSGPGYTLVGFLGRSLQLDLHYSNSNVVAEKVPHPSQSPFISETATVHAISLSIGARYFIGRSFFVRMAAGQNTFYSRIKYSVTSQTEPNLVDDVTFSTVSDINARNIFLNMDIGNQWVFDNGFIIDCHWIGFTQAISGSYSYQLDNYAWFVNSPNPLDSESNTLGKKYTKQRNFGLYIGLGYAL
ncbi:MAG: hypothetical protein NTZ90_18405 [Proteobacteria bacterium]|nr:hypothetical protein [Pseudomonadota bacterium]